MLQFTTTIWWFLFTEVIIVYADARLCMSDDWPLVKYQILLNVGLWFLVSRLHPTTCTNYHSQAYRQKHPLLGRSFLFRARKEVRLESWRWGGKEGGSLRLYGQEKSSKFKVLSSAGENTPQPWEDALICYQARLYLMNNIWFYYYYYY